MSAPTTGMTRSRLANSGWSTRLWILALLVGIGYLVLAPLYRLQQQALHDGAAGYRAAFDRRGVGDMLTSTLLLALGSLVIAVVLGTLLAWCASQLSPRLRWLRILPIFPIVVPVVASVIGWSVLLSPRTGYLNVLMRQLPWWSDLDKGPIDIYSLPWIILLTGFSLTSFIYLFVNSGMSNLNFEMIEAAQASGSSRLGVLFRVTIPLLRPVLVYGSCVALLLGLGQFTVPLLLGRNAGVRVITTDMFFFTTQTPVNYGAAAALASPLILIGLILVLGQKAVLGNQARFVTHGGKAFSAGMKPSKFAPVVIIFYSLMATVLPLAALALLCISPFWSQTIPIHDFTLENIRTILAEPRMTQAITTSLIASLGAVLIVLPLGYFVASILVRPRSGTGFVRTVLDFVVSVPLGIPAVVFGVGFFLTYTREPFFLYSTRWVIVLVYVTLMISFSVRMLMGGMISLGSDYAEASRTSGAGTLRTHLNILLPLLRTTIGGAAALMFVLLSHEFSASLLVRSPTTNVMGTVLYDYYINGSYPEVATIALLMTAITTAGVVLAIVLGGARALERL